MLQRVGLCDSVAVQPATTLRVEGFDGDTIVRLALEALAARAGMKPNWLARIRKEIPLAAGLGGGSTDAAAALSLANATLAAPLPAAELEGLAAALGSDVPFFLRSGPQLATADGSTLAPLVLPQDYWVVLVLAAGARKESTASVYRHFDERSGADGYEERRRKLVEALAGVRHARDLAALPANDLAASPLAGELLRLGAFRADVSGAGPVVYGLFLERRHAATAAQALRAEGRTWMTSPC